MTTRPIRRPRARRRAHVAIATGFLTLLLLAPGQGAAQEEEYRISQRGTISQKLGSTLVTLDYSRPLVRGRAELFGKVVHWGELWTPGANQATVLEVSDTVTLGGHVVPAGRWSMWIIPSRVGPWELVLDARDSLFHTQRPELTDDQIRFVVTPRHDAPQTEALTWSFPRIAQDGATLQLNWGTLEIPLELEVESVMPATTVAADEAALYVGTWQMTFIPDSATGHGMPPAVMTVRHADDGKLLASFPPGVFTPPDGAAEGDPAADAALSPQERERAEARRALAAPADGPFEYLLVPRARGVFLMGWLDDGELLDVEPLFHEFELENGRVVGLRVRDGNDRVMATGTRAPD